YLHWLILAAVAGFAVDPRVAPRVARAIDFLVAVRRPDGSLPAIGDADGGQLLPLAPRRADDASATFAVAAVLWSRADFAWAAPAAVGLLGPGAADAWAALAPAPPARAPSTVFPRGGWAVMRDDWGPRAHHVMFDVGPLGCPVSGGHGHADLLAIQASFYGEPL